MSSIQQTVLFGVSAAVVYLLLQFGSKGLTMYPLSPAKWHHPFGYPALPGTCFGSTADVNQLFNNSPPTNTNRCGATPWGWSYVPATKYLCAQVFGNSSPFQVRYGDKDIVGCMDNNGGIGMYIKTNN